MEKRKETGKVQIILSGVVLGQTILRKRVLGLGVTSKNYPSNILLNQMKGKAKEKEELTFLLLLDVPYKGSRSGWVMGRNSFIFKK